MTFVDYFLDVSVYPVSIDPNCMHAHISNLSIININNCKELRTNHVRFDRKCRTKKNTWNMGTDRIFGGRPKMRIYIECGDVGILLQLEAWRSFPRMHMPKHLNASKEMTLH